MKRIFPLLIILLLIILVTLLFCSNIICHSEQENPEIKWRAGVAIINGEPRYFDPAGVLNPDIFMSVKYRKKINNDIIKAGALWVNDEESQLYVYDVQKIKPYRRLSKTKRIFSFKVSKNKLYLSEDNQKWEEVKFKVIDDKEHIDENDSSITIYWVIYLECKWFKGEYEIISVPNA